MPLRPGLSSLSRPDLISRHYAAAVQGRWLAAGLVSTFLCAILAAPAAAATPTPTPATRDLTAGPPAGPWQVYDQGTGTRTAAEIWGSQASSVKGFADGYQKAWDQTGQGMIDRVERFTSTFWAALRLSESRTAAKQNQRHDSFQEIAGYGPSAYEVTDPADTQGFLTDTIVFTHGDYVGVVALAAVNSVPRLTLLDQARRQYDLLPTPIGEFQAIGAGVLIGSAVFLGVIAVLILLAVVVVVIVLVRSRRRQPAFAVAYAAAGLPGGGFHLSPDGRYWWDGQAWQDTAVRIPPGAQVSPDHALWWDGLAWRPVPPGAGAR
jgi:hypothetical protein